MNRRIITRILGQHCALCRRHAAAFIPGVFLLFLTACANSFTPLHQLHPATELLWPEKPEKPRIQWVKTISDSQDAGITKGFWKRALELIIGADTRPIVRPYGVLFDEKERLIIADPGARVVHCMDTAKGVYTVIGTESNSPLRTPIGIAEDDHDHLYITDSTTGAVYLYDLANRTLMPFLDRKLQRPTGIAWNRVNRLLYIVETTANQVTAVDESGSVRFQFGVTAEGKPLFNRPTDIAIDSTGKLYVTDPLNYRIRIFSPAGRQLNEIGNMGDAPGDMNKPKGVGIDSEGHIYVNDALLDAVQVFDGNGEFLLTFGQAGTGIGAFWMPSGIWVDRHDYIFVADTYNQRVQVFRYLSDRVEKPGGSQTTGKKDER
jgi:hypothetical protein